MVRAPRVLAVPVPEGPNRFNDGSNFGNKDRTPWDNNDFGLSGRDRLLNPDGSTQTDRTPDPVWAPEGDCIPNEGGFKKAINTSWGNSGVPSTIGRTPGPDANFGTALVKCSFTRGTTGPANAYSYVPVDPQQSRLARTSDWNNGFGREGRLSDEPEINKPLGPNFDQGFSDVGCGVNSMRGTWGGPPVNSGNQNGN